ncbi:MAG: AAA family ATPase [Gallionella sp.]|jgi:AAA15 family ATPase/GTPase
MKLPLEITFRNLMESRKLEPFVGHIRFPQYKNLTSDTRIDFTYPISALVGANGTNKSAILKALYGAPGYNNLGNFWFSTSIDPIEETGERPSCFIYGYWNAAQGKVVEVIKTRIKKEGDPDYWEPSRPLVHYDMEAPPKLEINQPIPEDRLKTRWKTIRKDVVYIDFRAALSGFDKFFYHGELRSKPNTEKNKKDFVRTRARHLKHALDTGITTLMYRRSERIINKENRILSTEEVNAISSILGRKYDEIKFIRHSLFNCDAYTCQMKVAGLKYTEAFAGSGEFAVVRIVSSVLGAKPHSLILLDEPEVSLHPGAQDRLIDFLSDCVKKHKHQVVISTHSPAIVRKLPPDAIKVLVMDTASGKVKLPRQSALPEEAFFHLGEPISDKVTVLVEDELAEAIVRRALISSGEAVAKLFDVRFFPGGSQTLWGHYLPIFAAEKRARLLVLLDGDQRPADALRDPKTIPEAEVDLLKVEIQRVAGVDIVFPSDGGKDGGNVAQQNAMRRNFISWAKAHVDYLPGNHNPEAFVWEHMVADSLTKSIMDKDPKERFKILTMKELAAPDFLAVSSSDILSTQRRRLATIAEDHVDIAALKDKLLFFAQSSEFTMAK